ncbi:MAG: DUF1552 domain-containing protein [Polyangiaceae bacterium]|nr:DUF1552 domain-containing protein [Polyangiaceae bacterium]
MNPSNLSRRFFLRGAAGAVLALPLLESLQPRRAARADGPPAHRFAVFVRQGNGVQQATGSEPERFWPSALGPLTVASMKADAGRAVSELADFAPRLLLVRGCKYNFSYSGCGHADGGLQCLTASKPDGVNGNKSLATNESIDWRIARGMKAGGQPLNLYAGQKGAYLPDVISYSDAGKRVAAIDNPLTAYTLVFGKPDASVEAQNKLALQRASVNDLVRSQMQALMSSPALSKSDQQRLQTHFDAVRDLELKLACHLPASRYSDFTKIDPGKISDDDQIDMIVKMQMDIIALSASCGLHHAMTLQIGNGNDQTQYVINGVKQERFHHISHRINSDGDKGDPIPDADKKHHEIDRLFARWFRYLLERLDGYDTPSGKLLDQGVAVWLNDLASGPPHGSTNLPYVCAGGCGGALSTGKFIDAADAPKYQFVTHNQFLNTIGSAVGVKNGQGAPLDDFGSAELPKGRIAGMLA